MSKARGGRRSTLRLAIRNVKNLRGSYRARVADASVRARLKPNCRLQFLVAKFPAGIGANFQPLAASRAMRLKYLLAWPDSIFVCVTLPAASTVTLTLTLIVP